MHRLKRMSNTTIITRIDARVASVGERKHVGNFLFFPLLQVAKSKSTAILSFLITKIVIIIVD